VGNTKNIETPEAWMPIDGFDGYEVSDKGKVRSYRKRNSPQLYKEPHEIKLSKKGRKGRYFGFYVSNEYGRCHVSVHRCVAKAFIPNLENKPQVHHIDNDGLNNHIDNLQWVTNSENQLARTDWNSPSGYRYVWKNRTTWRVYNKRLGLDKCFKTKNVAAAYAMQYY